NRELAGQVLGFIGSDGYGLGGVEYTFDRVLRGENGWSILQKDGLNKRYSRIGMPQKLPVPGADVYLTIDMHVQKVVEAILRQTVEQAQARGGMAMVMNPHTGDIVAMANVPGFNPNLAGRYTLQQRLNRCIAYNYEPGSTFKVLTAASAMQQGQIGIHDSLDANQGIYEIYDERIRDVVPRGVLSFADAVSYSSNVCFAKIAARLGEQQLFRYAKDFGLGAQAGIALPGEESGIVHPISQWSGRTLVTMAIGQEVSVTLLQMMLAFSAVANDGVLLVPRVCDKIVAANGQTKEMEKGQKVRRIMQPSVARELREVLRGVVDYGTAKSAQIPGITIGGKTGTGQKFDQDSGSYSHDNVWASFIGFAPVDKPEFVCGIVIDEPRDGKGGGEIAAPAFRKIVTKIISHPRLQYAERILDRPVEDKAAMSSDNESRIVPDVCGLSRDSAAHILKAEQIPFEIIGDEKEIAHQRPVAGGGMARGRALILYTASTENQKETVVPDCIGKDLRDAINAINLEGLIPTVQGAGTVTRQLPSVGKIVRTGVRCTLFCSYEG
ncbi:MAG: penicillin-binding transpeptidase domain-containing protein, partial [Chitinivibrionales bacterium]